MDFVVKLRELHFARHEGNGVEKTIGTDLGEDCRNGEVRGIRLDNRIELGLEVAKDGGRGERILEPLEGSLGCIVELELDILLEKVG
jgi:hypothetical protein